MLSREKVMDILNHKNRRWIAADGGYQHPQGLPMLDPAWGVNGQTV